MALLAFLLALGSWAIYQAIPIQQVILMLNEACGIGPLCQRRRRQHQGGVETALSKQLLPWPPQGPQEPKGAS